MEPLRPDSQLERDSVMIGSECMARRGVLQRARDELDSIVTSWPEAISITQLRSHTTVPWRQCVSNKLYKLGNPRLGAGEGLPRYSLL